MMTRDTNEEEFLRKVSRRNVAVGHLAHDLDLP
jgi:hypothetical protein